MRVYGAKHESSFCIFVKLQNIIARSTFLTSFPLSQVLQRFQSYGWHTLTVGDGDSDLKAIDDAVTLAKSVTDKPSLIKIR